MYWVEIRASVQRAGPPRLVPLNQVNQHRGFRSVVAYDDDVAEFIRLQGSTTNLRGMRVYADTLFMDFDGHEPTEFRAWLQNSGLAYEEFDSGNRSVHYHIPLEPIEGVWVPAAMKAWVREHAPTADISFYHPSGQYRLPGTYHYKKPGQCKLLTYRRDGARLRLTEPAARDMPNLKLGDSTRERFYTMLLEKADEGHRRPRIWLLATLAAEAGMPYEETLAHLRWWNGKFCCPSHTDDIIQRQCESAFRRLARKEA